MFYITDGNWSSVKYNTTAVATHNAMLLLSLTHLSHNGVSNAMDLWCPTSSVVETVR